MDMFKPLLQRQKLPQTALVEIFSVKSVLRKVFIKEILIKKYNKNIPSKVLHSYS